MIANIEPPNPNITNAVRYNEKKMDGQPGIHDHDTPEDLFGIENGHVLATRNVPEGETLLGEFRRLKLLHLKQGTGRPFKNYTFHMSVNPSETDRHLPEEEAIQFIDEVMEGLGYKDQPYRIYKHTDIERMHYHVVSCRAGQNARKIPDSFERLVLHQTLKQLAPKYGFTVILNEKEKATEMKAREFAHQEPIPIPEMPTHLAETLKNVAKKAKTEDKETEKKVVPAFSRKRSTPVTRQITDAFEDAMKWNFSTFEQLQALMLKRYNVLLEVERGEEDDHIVTCGTTSDGSQVTPLIRESELGIQMLERIREKCENANMAARREQRQRLEKLARAAAEVSATYEEFRSIMERKGTYVVLSWTRGGESFGVTYLDRATKCAWKGSETVADFRWLKGMAEKKSWTFTHDRQQQTIEKRSRMPSRKRMLVLRKDPPGLVTKSSQQDRSPAAVLLRGLFQIHGGHHNQGTSASRPANGDSLYDESLRKAEDEQVEKKKERNKYGPSL